LNGQNRPSGQAPGRYRNRENQMEKTIEQLFDECRTLPHVITYKNKNVIRVDHFPISSGDRLKVVFESVNSKWEQAIRLKSDGELKIEDDKGKNFALWRHNAPNEVLVECIKTKSGTLTVYNAWDTGTGSTDAWLCNSGMVVQELTNGRRYNCNDGQGADSFDSIVFRIERM
jgi:hypothetical protein